MGKDYSRRNASDEPQQLESEPSCGKVPASAASAGNATNPHGAEIEFYSDPLRLADRTEIEQRLQQWREGISIDITLLLGWSGRLQVTVPPVSMEYFRELRPDLRTESFLHLAFDWEGSGNEILTHDQITATLLNNLQKALGRYVHLAIDLIASKWVAKGLYPDAFASRMESAGAALEYDVSQMLRDGVSALANGASPEKLEQALSKQLRAEIAAKIELHRRDAQLIGRCELPKRDHVLAEYRATNEINGAMDRLPPGSTQKVQAKIDAADTLLTRGIKWLPTELQEGKRTKQEAEAILCQQSKEWAWEVFVTILREWAEIGIPPHQFEAIAKVQIESLSTHAEERVAGVVRAFQLSSGEVLRGIREFLPCLTPQYREENRFRFHAVTGSGELASPSKLAALGGAGGPTTMFPVRASWLKDRLLERGWGNSDPSKWGGPDRKTVEKILRGEAVGNGVLEKLADALSQRYGKVNVLEIPQS